MADTTIPPAGEPAKLMGRDALDRLELANCGIGSASALCLAVLDTLDKLSCHARSDAAISNETVRHYVRRAEVLMFLQQEQIEKTEEGIGVAVYAWPL